MLQQLEKADRVRRLVSPRTAQKRKSELGQFMTPSGIARYMASLFQPNGTEHCRLLDAGAGVGSLSSAFLDRILVGELPFKSVEVFAYEIDPLLREHLERQLAGYRDVRAHVIEGDFIELAGSPLLNGFGDYTHAILNPPYKKINSDSSHRFILRQVGIETVNLYSAFVALAVLHSKSGAQIVAIIPRSFCNGPYYRPFRDFVLGHAALRHIHLFKSRSKAFKDDDVLQENIIISLERGAVQGSVTISTSTDDTFADIVTHEYEFTSIVHSDDPERFIHVPTAPGNGALDLTSEICHSLEDLGIQVSTGPVVDFRMRDFLSSNPEPGTVPLLYPAHFWEAKTDWPKLGMKKPNAILYNDETEKWLYPNGVYCVVRRFSSKEEKRRIVASLVEPSCFPDAPMLGFENHLNVFHQNKQGLPEALALGLTRYLNTEEVDERFRQFNGHTQVNATDLRTMKYPSRKALVKLGESEVVPRSESAEV